MGDETGADFNEENRWLKNWIIGERITSGSRNSCNRWAEDSDENWKEHAPSEKKQLDYLVCGANDAEGSPCKQINTETWNQIWDNCHGKADEDQDETGDDGENWDTCWNMVTGNAGTNPPEGEPGGHFECSSGSNCEYNPKTGMWSDSTDATDQGNKDSDGPDGRWWGEWKSANYNLTPAYPTDVSIIGDNLGTDTHLDPGETHQCPSTHVRGFFVKGMESLSLRKDRGVGRNGQRIL